MIAELDIMTIEFDFDVKGKYDVNPFYDTLEELVDIKSIVLNDEENGDKILEFDKLSRELQMNILDACYAKAKEND